MPVDRVFVDTNVLVYALDVSAGEKHAVARRLLDSFWEQQNACVSVQVLQELHVTLTQKVAVPVGADTSRHLVDSLCSWRVHQPSCADLAVAIDLQGTAQLSFWDAMILTSAASLECSRLLSEDLNPGQRYGSVAVVNPFA